MRITPFILPVHTIVPFPKSRPRNFHAWVPIDDENTWVYFMHYSRYEAIDPVSHKAPFRLDNEYRKERHLRNKHLQDRTMMKTRNFSGIPHIPTRDYAVQESMEPIVDRSREHLGSSDIAVLHMRRVLLNCLKEFAAGKEPSGLDSSFPYERIDSDSVSVPEQQAWQRLMGT